MPPAPVAVANSSSAAKAPPASADPGVLLRGEAAMGDFTTDAPGVRRILTTADLRAPFETKSVDNEAHLVDRPDGAWPRVPAGFKVGLFASGLTNPRMARVAPNGDLFVVESQAGRVRVVRDRDGDGKSDIAETFAEGLKQPFGVNFYPLKEPRYVYVANTDSVIRYPYGAGDLKARGPAEPLVDDIAGGGRLRGGGHWTRDLVFSRDGSSMYVSVGSRSNVNDDASEARRARIFEFSPDGKEERVFATGIRNAVGLAIHPETGELWASVNERDELGENLVPDYITSVRQGGFYGWPWFYLGDHQDPRHAGKHPELRDRVIVPDVLLQSHSASLGMMFYVGKGLPEAYRGNAFAAQHGSWNRARRTGYKVVRLPMASGHAIGEYIDFMTGFVTPEGDVWGRPVAIAEAADGALFVTDDAGGCVWRVAYR
ncbi:MAG TPA: sorbosone dehydrogenase family protein [Polyangiaceae bacterium]|nr:sorbosone dehydrogenase family protein [Polyangiaceae bacterium]